MTPAASGASIAPRPPGSAMAHRVDLNTWSRREHFEFFRDYEDPYFSLCAEVDVSQVLRRASSPGGPSFFVSTLHLALTAANAVDELRYRLDGDGVVAHDVIHGGCTVLRDDRTFAFGYFDYDPEFGRFARHAAAVLAEARTRAVALDDRPQRTDLVYFSVIPWVSFTSFSHPHRLGHGGSVPRIVFGKYREAAPGRSVMPVSVEVHHALADGLHVGEFFDRFQRLLADEPPGVEKKSQARRR